MSALEPTALPVDPISGSRRAQPTASMANAKWRALTRRVEKRIMTPSVGRAYGGAPLDLPRARPKVDPCLPSRWDELGQRFAEPRWRLHRDSPRRVELRPGGAWLPRPALLLVHLVPPRDEIGVVLGQRILS